ncbi:MAG TPA: phospholipase D-like domain-containing protein [Balneolales bacterium]|nr:phospholipase D-like domain-containing protein [Balneolales bacterium]
MNRFKSFFPITLLALLLVTGTAFAGPADTTLQIVESVPVNTIYGQPGVPRTQKVWLNMIHGAKQSIDIAAFYITNKPGKALAPVIDAIAAKARAGVKVRILLDQTFYHQSKSSIKPLRGIPNLDIRVLPVDSLTGGVLHAKYFIVDSHTVFVGSPNWDWRALTQIHEIGARIDNRRFARTFEGVFNFDWHLAKHPNLPKAEKASVKPPDFAPVTEGNPVILHNAQDSVAIAFPSFSPPSLVPRWVDQEQPDLVHLIKSARHTLRIQVMSLTALIYYGPKGYWKEVDNALRDDAARGVKVRIIVANWSLREPTQQYLKSLAVLPNITVKFSSLPPAPSGFIPYARVEHCKYAVADNDRAYIGTGNWGWSYFNNTVDASVFFSGKGPVSTLVKIFKRDWNGPYVTTMKPGEHYKPPKNH